MDEASALMQQAKDGDAESLRRLLVLVQRPLRLTAAIFLPTLAEVDAVMNALTPAVVASLDEIPTDAPLPWMRRLLRDLINAQMNSTLNRDDDVVRALLRHAGRERLSTVPVDADPVSALQGRLRWMSKGATDLLVLRFTNGLPIERLAAQRALSVDNLCDALQTACRQLDWTGDSSGGGVDAGFYRVIDGVVCGSDNPEQLSDESRQQLALDAGLSLRAVRAARLHLIAAAWHAPDLPVTVPSLSKRAPPPPPPPPPVPSVTAPAAPARRQSTPTLQRPTGNRGASTPTRRQLALRGSDLQRPTTLADDEVQTQRTGLIVTLIGGALVLGALALLLLRGGTTTIAPTVVVTQPPTTNEPATTTPVSAPATPPSVSTPGPVAAVSTPVTTPTPAPDTASTPATPAEKSLFTEGILPAPLAAWSTRRLVATYTGPLMRVRRSGDQAERDIGFTASGSLDSAALLLFTSRSSAHVVCWYDQSGNNHHMQQPEYDKQPRIVIDGNLEVENTRPVVSFDRTRFEHFLTPAGIKLGSIYAVLKVRSYGDGAQGLMGSLAKNSNSSDAYYPILDRDRRGECEWWVGQKEGYQVIRTHVPRDRLLLWNSATDGQQRPKIQLRLDGKEVGSLACNSDALVPIGPTSLGCLYWDHRLADPFGGSLGECFVIRSGMASSLRDLITNDLKRWWKTP